VTGFVGMEVLARFLQRSQRHIFALIRAPSDADAYQRLRAVLATAFGDPDSVIPKRSPMSRRRIPASCAMQIRT
jgi:thioester reductase-like protein